MKELSVVVLGDGRWARALTGLLNSNQNKQRGHIQRVTRYSPPALPAAPVPVAPPQKRPAVKADSDDATMMGISADSFKALTAPAVKGRPAIKADSDDATMMGISADAFKGLGGPVAIKSPRVLKADSDDATMMGMTADSFKNLGAPGLAPAKGRPAIKADSDDATMMGMTADSFKGLGGPVAIKNPRAALRADSDDATMMGMTADSFAALAGATPGRALRADSDDATMMGLPGEAFSLKAPQAPPPALPALLEMDPDLKEVGSADVLLITVAPSQVRAVLRHIRPVLRPQQTILHCVGGFVPADPGTDQPSLLISDVIRQETPVTRIGALAGPVLAQDLEESSPAALVCGSPSEVVVQAARQILGCQTLRIYGTPDLLGVEVARAMSSVIALASGICDVLEFGPAARAWLVSRSVAEVAQLGAILGGRERTFRGLAGFGSFMLASEHRGSADFELGQQLGKGVPLHDAQKKVDRACDSLDILRDANSIADGHGLRTPILHALHGIICGSGATPKIISELLSDTNYVD